MRTNHRLTLFLAMATFLGTMGQISAATLTVVLSPATMPAVMTPDTGDHDIQVGTAIPIDAATLLPTEYAFYAWTVSGDAVVADPKAASTTVTMLSDAPATLACYFVSLGEPVKLTMMVSPAHGSTTPAANATYTVDTYKPIAVNAIPDARFKFVKWQAGDGIVVAAPQSAETTIAVFKTATLTAIFDAIGNPTFHVAPGSFITVYAQEVGQTTFTRMPRAYFLDAGTGPGLQTRLVKSVTKPWAFPTDTVQYQWTQRKSVGPHLLYLDTWKRGGQFPKTTLTNSFIIEPPVITAVEPVNPIPGQDILVKGTYFGSIPNQVKVMFAYSGTSLTTRKIKELIFEPSTGTSSLKLQLPASVPSGTAVTMTLINGASQSVTTFTTL